MAFPAATLKKQVILTSKNEDCTSLIMQTLNRPNSHTLAYQSRVGPVEWLQPYTEDAIKELGAGR